MIFADTSENAADWEMAMFTDSNDYVFAIMIVIAFILVTLSIWIFVLHRKERKSETKIDSGFL